MFIGPTTPLLELLNLIIERARQLPVLALVTFRPEFEAPWAGLPNVGSLVLGRLSREDVERVVTQVRLCCRLANAASRRSVCDRRQGELKLGAAGQVRARPQSAAVRFNDRTTDRQAHPHALGLGRVESLENALKVAGAKPGPESGTSTDTPSGSLRVPMNNCRSFSPTSRIASMALMIKLSSTCCSWTRSPWTRGKPSANCVRTETLLFAASVRVSTITSRMASLIATASFRAGAFLMSTRIRPTTSPAQFPSLTIRESASSTS